jgi:tetratricopeptide (TPR) repeat protein
MLILLVSLQLVFVKAQERDMDSLRRILLSKNASALPDSMRIKTMISLSWLVVYSDPDSAIRLTNTALLQAQKSGIRSLEGKCFHALGWFYDVKSEYSVSLEYYSKAMQVWDELSAKKNKGGTLGNMGSVYANLGDFPKAIDLYFQSQLMLEQVGDKESIAIGNNNIGLLYYEKSEYKKALEYYFKALNSFKELKHIQGIQYAYSNIGSAYHGLKDKEKAIGYLNMAFDISKESGDLIGQSTSLGALGLVYHDNDAAMALSYYQKALAVASEVGDKSNIAIWHGNIGELYLRNHNYPAAEEHLSSALTLFKEMNDKDGQMEAEGQLSEIYEKTGRKKLALEYFRRFSILKDSLFSAEKERAITFREMSYEFDKKQSEEAAIHDKAMALFENQAKKQRLIIWLAVAGFLMIAVFLGFVFRSIYITKKQKNIIGMQKNLVEQKQKEILDSIYYARRIQKALLPTEKFIARMLKLNK